MNEEVNRKLFGMERPVAFFLLFWLVLNIIQVSLSELTSDEGYYWFYSQHLQWGYYDHPPLIALMIKGGTVLFPGELGVRFFNVILSTAGLYLFFTLLPDELKKTKKPFLVLLAAPLLHYLTFLVFPDGPLLFFSLLFLVTYKKFLRRQNMASAFLLGLALAFMAYSKYHGALVLLFTLLSNPKLFKSLYFYMALFVAAVLFLPHMWWQYQNDFPTLKYHLSGRTSAISLRYVGEFLSQQIFAIGPGLIFIPFVVTAKDLFERALKFIIIGTFIFFLFSSFKTFVHFHWTSIALYPLLYFAVAFYNNLQKKKLFTGLIIPFVVLFTVVRILLAIPVIPAMHVGEDYYHGRSKWANEIKAVAGDRYVFMPDNLREASLYSFYSGGKGVALYTRQEKKSQYELWGYEDSLQHKEVLFLTKYQHAGSKTLPTTINALYYSIISSFQSYYTNLSFTVKDFIVSPGYINANVQIINTGNEAVSFQSSALGQFTGIVYSIEQQKKIVSADVVKSLQHISDLKPGEIVIEPVVVPIKDLSQGDYQIYFGIRSEPLPDANLTAQKNFSVK